MKICLFYRYMPLSDAELSSLDEALHRECSSRAVLGRFLLSRQGINGSFSSTEEQVDSLIDYLKAYDTRFCKIDYKFSYTGKGGAVPFNFLAIKIVDEIIGTGLKEGGAAPPHVFDDASFGGLDGVGIHLAPSDFHDKVLRIVSGQEKGIILDVRNEYEYDIGHFEGATNLKTYYYSETWRAMESALKGTQDEDTEVLMYCTGGIRCELASKFAKSRLGRSKVFQLQGGVHRYLEAYRAEGGGLFRGKNFVFDATVSNCSSSSSSDKKDDVVGRCIDCGEPHEAYSGKICCTVCRYPLLCCNKCAESNKHNDEIIYEFYCKRHRYLKDKFFTVLSRFSQAELQQQQRMLEELLVDPSFSHGRRKTINKQIRRIRDLISSGFGTDAEAGEKQSDAIYSNPQLMINRPGGFWQS